MVLVVIEGELELLHAFCVLIEGLLMVCLKVLVTAVVSRVPHDVLLVIAWIVVVLLDIFF